jgi:hypothetical protein
LFCTVPRFINGQATPRRQRQAAMMGKKEACTFLSGVSSTLFPLDFPECRRNFPSRFIHARKTSSILCPPETENGMTDWDKRANWNRDMLERIVALLFALANLADLAADAPFLRRRHVLEILGHGEAEARAFVMGVAFGEPALMDTPESTGDAARLAASFRALALALCALLARARQSARLGITGSRASRCRPAEPASHPAALPPPDT